MIAFTPELNIFIRNPLLDKCILHSRGRQDRSQLTLELPHTGNQHYKKKKIDKTRKHDRFQL